MSTSENLCRSCKNPLPAASRGGLCPACLIGEAFDSLDTLPDETAEPNPGQSSRGPDPLEGATLGPEGRYKILQRIGEGGFGTVYMADQVAPVKRRVAIKILKAGMDTRQVVARFEAERQALAMMDHPNIAKVLDGGETEQGRPFFVMELVRGTPITEFCDEEALPTRQRLDLFLVVCRAVQHAHQKGIIHRDLKPGNILVTLEDGADAVPKVIDFGVAKAMETSLTDKTLFTRFEQMIGTPAYMSPEQAGSRAAHDLDTRADIYALGVLLYELLTGTTPFESDTLQRAAFDEVRRILREEEAPRPSARLSSLQQERRTTIARSRGAESNALGKQLRGDLDWIVMKAIEKDRKRRYETANALALDVERHIEDEPVSAGPPTVAYRTKKFLRRHKVGVGIAAMFLISVLGGLALAAAGFAKAKEEARKAREAEGIAERERETAQLINDFVVHDLLGQASSAETTLNSEFTMRDAIDRAAATIDQRFADRPTTRAEIHGLVGRAYELIGSPDSALRHSQEHREFIEKEFGVQSPVALRAQVAGAAALPSDQKVEILEQVLSAQRRLLGDSHLDTLKTMHALVLSLNAKDAGARQSALATEKLNLLQKNHPQNRYDIGISKLLLGQVLGNSTDEEKEEAIKWLKEAIADLEEFGETNPNIESKINQAKSEIELTKGSSQGYEAALRLELSKAMDTFGAEGLKTMDPCFKLGWYLGKRQTEHSKIVEGVALLERALRILKTYAPGDYASRAHFEMCLNECQRRAGLWQDAIDLLRGTLDEIRASGFGGAVGKYSEETYLSRLHFFYYRHDDVDGVEEVYRPAVEAAVRSDGFVEASSSKYFHFLLKCRFVADGESGLRQLLRDLGQLSDPTVEEVALEPYVEEAVRSGTFHAALIAARRGTWHRAYTLLDRHRELGGEWQHENVFLGFGALAFRLGDRQAFSKRRKEALERYSDSENPKELDLTAIFLLLDPEQDSPEDIRIAGELARRAKELHGVKAGEKEMNGLNCLAGTMAELRGGKRSQFVKALEPASRHPKPILQAAMYACLAIARADEGESGQAQAHLAQAEKLLTEWTLWGDASPWTVVTADGSLLGVYRFSEDKWAEKWVYRLIAETLFEEARALVE